MAEPLYLAVDLGTSGPKVAVITQKGTSLASFFFPVPLIFCDEKGVEQSPSDWWKGVRKGIAEVLKSLSTAERRRIVGLCCTSQWSGTVPLDKNGRPLMNCLTWMDARGAPWIKNLVRGWPGLEGYRLEKLWRWLYKTGGLPGLAGKDPLAHILWVKNERPEVFEKVWKFLEPKDYLNFLLTGKIASSYDTICLHWLTNNRNINRVDYDQNLLEMCGLPRHLFPDLQSSVSFLAPLKECLRVEFGLPGDVQVVTGSPDLQTAAVGSGAVEDYATHLYIGTSSWITCHVPFKKTDIFSGIATLPSALPGRYFVANEQESAGICLDYLRKHFFPGMTVQHSGVDSETDDFVAIERMGSMAPAGSRNLMFTPWLNGERTPLDDHFVRGGFYNMSLRNKPEDYVRAVYEGVAYNSRWLLQCVSRFIRRPVGQIHFIGGGACSPLWAQIHADVLNCTVLQTDEPRLANLRGAAWIAGVGRGDLSVSDIPRLVRIQRRFKPETLHAGMHAGRFQEFKNIYRSNRKIYRRLNSLSPGVLRS